MPHPKSITHSELFRPDSSHLPKAIVETSLRPLPDAIVFTHYGRSDYLSRTLECATITNPRIRRVLIGDDTNRDLAVSAGWNHIHLDAVTSDLRTRFNEVFRWVQGPKHNPVKNGKDWLRYVFERWYVVAEYCRVEGIQQLWHFDSDVMLVEDLAFFGDVLRQKKIIFTRQCNDTCLNGFVSYTVVKNFCEYIIGLFNDPTLLQSQQLEFETLHLDYAFTEMRAFAMYSKITGYQGCHLEQAIDGWWFDDCICQDDDFEMRRLGFWGTLVKRVHFDGSRFYGHRQGGRVDFAAINCSWVPTEVFDWILSRVRQRVLQPGLRASEELAQVHLRMLDEVKGLKAIAVSKLR